MSACHRGGCCRCTSAAVSADLFGQGDDDASGASCNPQAFGCLPPTSNMLGNVWEWCWDTYDAEVYGTYRVLRGGGWFDEHWSCRASVRRRSHPTFQIDDVGFRIARTELSPSPFGGS